MKNLGKTILFLLLSLSLWAEISVSVDKEQVTRGERVTLTLRIFGDGRDVEVPPLNEVCGVNIEGRMQSRKEIFSNGKRLQERSLMYEFMPQRSCVIEPIIITVNGKEEKTEPINITVSKVAISRNEPFIVELEAQKDSVYVGEPFEVKVNFKARRNIDTLAESISLPENKNIWVKSEEKGSPFISGEYVMRKNEYAMAAQQSGQLSLGPLRWDLKVRSQSKDYWGTWLAATKTRSVFSNELDIKVKALPEDINLVGKMNMDISVNKMEVNAGEAINLTIKVEGRANIEDIEAFDLHVPGTQVFEEEPQVSHFLQDGRYFGSFTQKVAFVAERDFTIPVLTLTYMDVETDSVKTIQTEAISVKVLNASALPKEELKVTRPQEKVAINNEEEKASLSFLEAIFVFLSGMVFGTILFMTPWKRLLRQEKNKTTIPAKASKEVLQLLMPHMDRDSEIEEMVQKLSENLYEGGSHPIDKKSLKEIVRKVQK